MQRIPRSHASLAAVLLLGLTACGCGDDDKGGGPDEPILEPGPISVTGTVTYDSVPAFLDPSDESVTLDFEAASQRPVRGAVVQLLQGTNVLTTTTTNASGGYALAFTTETADPLRVAVLARTTDPEIQVEDNTDDDAIWGLVRSVESATSTLDFHATHGWQGTRYDATARTAAPFALLDAIYTAAQAFRATRTIAFPALHVNWSPDNVPQSGNKAQGAIGTSHYDPQAGEIFVLGKDGVDTDEFDSHVIVHEWTHYVEAQLSRSDSPGGPHGAGDVLDPRIAFGEGLANAVAAMALGDSIYVDTLWNGGTLSGFGVDAESEPTPSDDTAPGVFSELTVHRLAYDLFDDGDSETFDQVALGLGPIYDVLRGPQRTTEALTTIGSFVAALKDQPGVDTIDVDALLDHYSIGPITNEWGDGDAQLASIYTHIPTLPYNAAVTLTGGVDFNKRSQNQYFVFVGTGAGVTVTASHATKDVGVELYRAGELLGSSDEFVVGDESFSVASTVSGATYVVVLIGFDEIAADYAPTLSITSP